MRTWGLLAWASYFCGPLLFLLGTLYLQNKFHTDLSSLVLFRVAFQNFLQALLSTAAILVVGFLVALGLMAGKSNSVLRSLLILPSFTPSIFILTSLMAWLSYLDFSYHSGLSLVIFAHLIMNAGLTGVLLKDVFLDKMSLQWQLAFIEGVRAPRFFKEAFFSLKYELSVIAAGIFLFCFTSFSVPLVLGGHLGKTLEVLSYERLVLNADIFGAIIVAFTQMLLFSLLLVFLKPQSYRHKPGQFQLNASKYGVPGLAFFLAILLAAFAYMGLFAELLSGYQTLTANSEALRLSTRLAMNSTLYALSAGLISFLLFSILLLFYELSALRRFLVSFALVSTALIGVSLFLVDLAEGLKLTYAYSILYFPVAYRFYGPSLYENLDRQHLVLKSMGGSRLLNFYKVLLPQALPQMIKVTSLVTIWSLGDFAMTSVITGELQTLAQLIKTVLSSYRTELAAALSFVLLIIIALVYLIFEGLAYVSRKKLYS